MVKVLVFEEDWEEEFDEFDEEEDWEEEDFEEEEW
ncbi:hypothetical protein SJAV_12930 [Sulfurisphaera javensis]|uniref:Pyruvate dehydrogenase n=1 Tax=Sulfurisphaera javensis TaxID=2049879 RepID=A0AAT9GRM2_9CREN